MTIPSVLSMYGVVLGYLTENSGIDLALWNEKIILTPILFVAFWSLADPWTRTIVSMASIPRLVGIVGVILLSTGVVASGYLATGGVGAYLASISAGAVMGIGASFVTLQSEHVLRKHFRRKLLLALTLKNVGTSFGLLFVPCLTHVLLHETDLRVGLLLMTIIFFPTAMGTLTLRAPVQQPASPYRLLLGEEDNELPIRLTPDVAKDRQRQRDDADSIENFGYTDMDEREDSQALFGEGGNIYAYQEPDEDVDLFVNPTVQQSKWRQQLRALNAPRFWAVVLGSTGVKAFTLFFWILLSPVSVMRTAEYWPDWIMLSVIAAIGTFIPNIASYKVLGASSQFRKIYFGASCWVSSVVMIGLICGTSKQWFFIWALLGGVSVGSLSSCQDLAIYDALGTDMVARSHKALSTLNGGFVLIFCLLHDEDVWLLVTALLQIIGGFFWVSSSVLELIKARIPRPTRTTTRPGTSQT